MKNGFLISGFGFLVLSIPMLAQQPGNPVSALSPAREPDPTVLLGAPEKEDAASPQEAKVDEFPKPLKKVEPWYPELAQKAGIEGKVYVQMSVDTAGNVSDVKILKSDHDVLNEAALQAARQWTFTPAMKDGKKLAIILTVPFAFKLADRPKERADADKVGYALLKTVKALLSGSDDTDPRQQLIPGATLIDGTAQVDLLEAVEGKSKSDAFSAERGRAVSTIRMMMNDQMSAATVVAMTAGKKKSGPSLHTVVWVKTGEGKWKIQHWHTSH